MSVALTDLRRQLRSRRAALPAGWRREAGRRLVRNLRREPLFWRARRIAFYISSRGEPDLADLLTQTERAGKSCFLPVIRPGRRLAFVRWRTGEPLHSNRFGIPEPRFSSRAVARTWSIDLVLVPLVAFDAEGRRLGMGGGFYDRTLACRRQGAGTPGPRLCGVAWQWQEVQRLPERAWDVPLDAVVTEIGCHHFASRQQPVDGP